jgi:hypothetical protein
LSILPLQADSQVLFQLTNTPVLLACYLLSHHHHLQTKLAFHHFPFVCFHQLQQDVHPFLVEIHCFITNSHSHTMNPFLLLFYIINWIFELLNSSISFILFYNI